MLVKVTMDGMVKLTLDQRVRSRPTQLEVNGAKLDFSKSIKVQIEYFFKKKRTKR